jgi:hypothetical protein
MPGKRVVQVFKKVRPDNHIYIYIPSLIPLIPYAKPNTHHTLEHTLERFESMLMNPVFWGHINPNKSLNGKIIGYQLLGHKSIEILVKMSCIIVFVYYANSLCFSTQAMG